MWTVDIDSLCAAMHTDEGETTQEEEQVAGMLLEPSPTELCPVHRSPTTALRRSARPDMTTLRAQIGCVGLRSKSHSLIADVKPSSGRVPDTSDDCTQQATTSTRPKGCV